jgi:hypothetical protein
MREARRKFHSSVARARQAMLTGVKIAVTQQCQISLKRPALAARPREAPRYATNAAPQADGLGTV